MPSDTSLRITDASGNFLFETRQFLEIGNAPGLHYVLSCGKVGALTVTLPPDYNDMLLKDGRIHVMRSVNGAPATREGDSCYLIRKWDYADNYTIVTALHANHIFWRRYSLWGYYQRNSEYAGLPVDDAIKQEVWGENFGVDAGPGGPGFGRDSGGSFTQADISAIVGVQATNSLAPFLRKQYYWMSCGDVILETCDASFTAGTYLAAEIVCPTEAALELRTYTGQRGVDRRYSSGNGLLFAASRGNFANGLLTVDAINEVTAAVAAGPTRDSGTSIYAAEDTVRMGESPLGRIEVFIDDASGTNTDNAAIQDDANGAVRNGRPVIMARGDLIETDTCMRGVHFDFGDLVPVAVRDKQYDMRLDLLDITLSGAVETAKAVFVHHG